MDFAGKSWGQPTESRKPCLLDQVRIACWQRRFSHRTDMSYVYWIRQFILFNDKRHPNDMGKQEIEGHLNHLATRRKVSASTQSGTLNAIVFLYPTDLQTDQLAAQIPAMKKSGLMSPEPTRISLLAATSLLPPYSEGLSGQNVTDYSDRVNW
ncbi:MAG: phage integrase N-terminal SAM-like domain-containing protein [Candidatus Thiodiazotropha sp.]